jgi:hypothetical protein
MPTERIEIRDIPADRLDNTIELRRLDGWRVQSIRYEPNGTYTVVFER